MKSAQKGQGVIVIVIVVAIVLVVGFLLMNKMSKNGVNPASQNQTQVSAPTQAPEPGVVELMLDPAMVSTTANKTFTVNVKIDTKTETVSAVDLHVNYDKSMLEATSVKNGTFLPVVLPVSTPAAGAMGDAHFIVGSQPTAPQKGMGTVATITFKALKMGSTDIKVDSTTQVAAIGKKTSVLGSTTGTMVTIK